MADYTQLNGITNTQDVTLSNILLDNFISFYDWGFLDKGGFYNVQIPSSGMYGGTKAKLAPLKDPNYTAGQVWQGNRENWVWETGTSVGTPINISGVFVSGIFRATGNVQQPYYINYPQGQVIFDTALPVSSNVQVAYSTKWLNVIPAKGVPWFREIQRGANRVDSTAFTQYGSGGWAVLGQSRVQLPALAIDVVPASKMSPYQLGGGQLSKNDIVFNVVAENEWECRNIMDQITYQNDRSIYLYDPNKMAASGVSVFNYKNELNTHARASGMYPFIVDNFRYKDCFIYDSSAQEAVELNTNLWMGVVRCKTEVKPI
jgi:hypothetical protein